MGKKTINDFEKKMHKLDIRKEARCKMTLDGNEMMGRNDETLIQIGHQVIDLLDHAGPKSKKDKALYLIDNDIWMYEVVYEEVDKDKYEITFKLCKNKTYISRKKGQYIDIITSKEQYDKFTSANTHELPKGSFLGVFVDIPVSNNFFVKNSEVRKMKTEYEDFFE